ARMEFWRNGEKVGETSRLEGTSDGSTTATLMSAPGGFDEVRFYAVDNGSGAAEGPNANSDFSVESIRFLQDNPGGVVIASATGRVSAVAGDGVQGYTLQGIEGYQTQDLEGEGLRVLGDNGQALFDIRLTPSNGTWDFVQYQQMADDTNITFTIGATDRDGDTATITQQVFIEGVGDGIPPVITWSDDIASLITDDTDLRDASSTATTQNFANNLTVNAAGENPVAVVYGLSMAQAGIDSGLTTSGNGEAIRFYMENGEVVGRVGGEDGAEALRISVNDQGDVTLAQSMAVSHPDTSEDNEAVNLQGAGIRLDVTVTDSGGDTSESSIDLGAHLGVRDDGISFNAGQSTYTPTTDAANVPTIQDGDYSFAGGDWSYAQSIGFGDFTVEARGLEGNGALVSQS
ncbi:DUF5801 repeats-in-toxin domain-containing protein, partial [Kushneria aurantia]